MGSAKSKVAAATFQFLQQGLERDVRMFPEKLMPTPHVSDELIEDSSAQSSEKEDEDEEEEEDDQEEESEEEEEARAWLLLRQQNGTLFICAAAFSCSRSMAVAAAVKWHALNLRSRVQLQQEHGCCCISRL
eukprot:s2643_g14.t2